MRLRSRSTSFRELALALALAFSSGCGAEEGDSATGEESAGAPQVELLELPEARDLDPRPDAVEVVLRVGEAATGELRPGVETAILAYSDGAEEAPWRGVVGPLIRARVGDTITIHLDNALAEEATTLHLHGVRLPAAVDGNPAVEGGLFPGERRTYTFVARDPGLFWYHPHINTARQMASGLKGPLLVEEPVGASPARERILVVDQVALTADGAALRVAEGEEAVAGPRDGLLVVNGRPRPTARAIAGARERWRLVNASSHRRLHLEAPAEGRWTVIGGDVGALEAARVSARIELAPGERADVLVDLRGQPGERLEVVALEVDAGHGHGDPAEVLLGVLLEEGEPGPPVDPRGFSAAFDAIAVGATTPRRDLVLAAALDGPLGPAWTINGELWPFGAPIELELGALEIWQVTNESAGYHPIHLHGTFFQVLAGELGDPAIGWKDTLELAPGATRRLAVRFDEPGHWLFHCQTPSHAERGMMADVYVDAPAP